jgi:hypothetical protein
MVALVKELFGYFKDKLDDLIKFAESPSGAQTEETAEDIEEAKLDHSWDLNAADNAPTQCLADQERKIMVLSRQILADIKLP